MRKRNNFRKVRHDRHYRLEHEGMVWELDIAEWRDEATGKGQLRVYAVHGDITTPLLHEALELEATARAYHWR